MQKSVIRHILTLVAEGGLSTDKALDQLSFETAQDALHGLNLDPQRELRSGLGEVIFAQGKSDETLLAAVDGLSRHGPVLVSRVSREQAGLLRSMFPAGLHWPEAGLFSLGGPEHLEQQMTPPWPQSGAALVVSAGAADMAVALEAFGALAFWGCDCGCVTDVGVAGLHRLSPHLRALHEARVIIAVAGMEGALPGVLAGPRSGTGRAHFGGLRRGRARLRGALHHALHLCARRGRAQYRQRLRRGGLCGQDAGKKIKKRLQKGRSFFVDSCPERQSWRCPQPIVAVLIRASVLAAVRAFNIFKVEMR